MEKEQPKKIKIITTYHVYNYGASLQAYALMQYLMLRGHEVEVIKYQPPYLSVKYDYKWVNPESKAAKYWVTRWIYRIAKYVQRQTTMLRKRAFDDFTRNVIKETKESYTSYDQLKNNVPIADVYICGSDQIWNVFYETGRDPAFYLNFVPQGKRKISYAASFSYLDVGEEMRKKIGQYLESFHSISVREYQGVELLVSMGLTGTWVLDPVFLIKKEKWDEFSKMGTIDNKLLKEPYLLIYDFENNQHLKLAAIDYAKKKHLKIYNVNDTYSRRYADKNFSNAGPYEFVQLICNCSAFMSNSFHGTAFSFIFKKPFWVFKRNRHAVNSRMESLLYMFEEKKRMIGSFDDYMKVRDCDIDWDNIEIINTHYLKISESFLKNAICDEEKGS